MYDHEGQHIGFSLCVIVCNVLVLFFRVGIIEWVKNTKPLKEFLMDDDTEKKKALYVTLKLVLSTFCHLLYFIFAFQKCY